MIQVVIKLKDETEPRICHWDPNDFTQLADLDEAVGGLLSFELSKLWHVTALLWVCCARDMTLREFAQRLPITASRTAELFQAGKLIWQKIT